MNAHGIDVLDETDSYLVTFCIPYHFKFQFFPAQYRFLYKYLPDKAGRYSPGTNSAQFIHVIGEPSACPAHGVSRPDDYRIADIFRYLFSSFYAEGGLTAGCLHTNTVHGLLENSTVLATLDGVGLHSYDLDAVFFKDAFFIKFKG